MYLDTVTDMNKTPTVPGDISDTNIDLENLIIGGFTKNQYMGGNCLKEGSFDNLQV